MSTSQTLLRLGVFTLLALSFLQCQTGNSTPPPAANKTADATAKKTAEAAAKKAAVDKTAADKKAADEAAAKKAAENKPAVASTSGTPSPATAATTTGPWHVLVDSVASDQMSLDVIALYPSDSDKTTTIPGTTCTTQDATCKRLHLVVQDSIVKDQLKQLHKGDHTQVVYATDASKNQNTLKALSVDSISDTSVTGVCAMLGSAVISLLLYCFLSGFKPQQLIIGEDNRYSNSKFQMALWFLVLITSYIAALWIRVWAAGWHFIGGVNIPNNLLMLSGLSALTFGGAKAITSTKSGAPGEDTKTTADKPSFFWDLTHDDGTRPTPAQPARDGQPAVLADPGTAKFDFGDFQMLVITLIAVVTYIILIFDFFGSVAYAKVTTLPDVDTTILATFGLGQGAYLTKKAVGDVGTS